MCVVWGGEGWGCVDSRTPQRLAPLKPLDLQSAMRFWMSVREWLDVVTMEEPDLSAARNWE
jgi:hypothetical protein